MKYEEITTLLVTLFIGMAAVLVAELITFALPAPLPVRAAFVMASGAAAMRGARLIPRGR